MAVVRTLPQVAYRGLSACRPLPPRVVPVQCQWPRPWAFGTLSLTPKIVLSVSDGRRQNRSAVIHHSIAVPRFARRQLTAQANEAPCSSPALGHQLLRRNPGAPRKATATTPGQLSLHGVFSSRSSPRFTREARFRRLLLSGKVPLQEARLLKKSLVFKGISLLFSGSEGNSFDVVKHRFTPWSNSNEELRTATHP